MERNFTSPEVALGMFPGTDETHVEAGKGGQGPKRDRRESEWPTHSAHYRNSSLFSLNGTVFNLDQMLKVLKKISPN